MIIRSPEPEVKIVVDRDPVKTSFEEWAKPGHFSRTIAKGPDTTTWISNTTYDNKSKGKVEKMIQSDFNKNSNPYHVIVPIERILRPVYISIKITRKG